MKTLETERLILRPFTLNDLDDFFEYCSLETVGPNAGWAAHHSKEFSKKIIENFIEKDDVLALFHKKDKKVIGSIGLHKKNEDDLGEYYEIGYVLSTPYEGQGLMTETVRKVIEHAFNDLNLDIIYCGHFIENSKSRRVIEKCYFKYIGNRTYKSVDFGDKESKFYSLSKEDYTKYMEGNK